jgi:hypothetical protein
VKARARADCAVFTCTVPAVPPNEASLPAIHAVPVTGETLADQFAPVPDHVPLPPRALPLAVQ